MNCPACQNKVCVGRNASGSIVRSDCSLCKSTGDVDVVTLINERDDVNEYLGTLHDDAVWFDQHGRHGEAEQNRNIIRAQTKYLARIRIALHHAEKGA